MEDKIKDLENYLNDLDNLIDTGWFPEDSVKECTFYHQSLTLREFIQVGRGYISNYLLAAKGAKESGRIIEYNNLLRNKSGLIRYNIFNNTDN